jgi:hypothetical protein
MKSTLSKREKEQRAEWVLDRMDAIRKQGKTVPTLRELKQLQNELDWLQR